MHARRAPEEADTKYVPDTGAPDFKPQPEAKTKPEVLGRKDLDAVFRNNPRWWPGS